MQRLFFCLLFLLGLTPLYCQETVLIKEPQVPILINRSDNALAYIRVMGDGNTSLNTITMELGGSINMYDIKSLKLYYGGTEGYERREGIYYYPTNYISRDNPNFAKHANLSYSILKDEVIPQKQKMSFNVNQPLVNGVNYFWISIELKETCKLSETIEILSLTVNIDGKRHKINTIPIIRRVGMGVRYAGDDGAAAYRIPGVVTSNKGTLLSVYDVRYNSSVDLQEYVNVGLSRSTDGGKTWDKMQTIIDFGEYGGLPKAQNGVGDPAILVDKKTGNIWVIAAWTHGMGNGRAWFNSKQGMAVGETAQLVLVKSEDDGLTWSEPINITNQVKHSDWYFLLQGPGTGITMDDGTLVFASQFIGADRIPNAGVIYSQDGGENWEIQNYARSNTTEAQVVELSPGELMLNMRDNRGGSRAVSITNDLGKTWVEHPSSRKALQEPVCMASLIRVKANDNILNRDILLFSNPNSTSARNNITIKASLDGGLTWKVCNQLLLDEGHAWGYSSLTMIDKEHVGILYECSEAHLVFQSISLSDIIKDCDN